MKKLIAGIMSLLVVGAMALPVAAQGRNWNRDNQGRHENSNDRRDNNRSQWRNENHREGRFNERRGWNDFDRYDWNNSWRRGRDRFHFNDRRFNNHRD